MLCDAPTDTAMAKPTGSHQKEEPAARESPTAAHVALTARGCFGVRDSSFPLPETSAKLHSGTDRLRCRVSGWDSEGRGRGGAEDRPRMSRSPLNWSRSWTGRSRAAVEYVRYAQTNTLFAWKATGLSAALPMRRTPAEFAVKRIVEAGIVLWRCRRSGTCLYGSITGADSAACCLSPSVRSACTPRRGCRRRSACPMSFVRARPGLGRDPGQFIGARSDIRTLQAVPRSPTMMSLCSFVQRLNLRSSLDALSRRGCAP